MAVAAALAKFSDRIPVAIPFFIAALLTAVNGAITSKLGARASDALSALFTEIKSEGGKNEGPPQARFDHFLSISAWTGDVNAAFTSVAGLVASTILILHTTGTTNGVTYTVVGVAIATIFALASLFLARPTTYGWKALSAIQIVLLVANVALGGAILIFG